MSDNGETPRRLVSADIIRQQHELLIAQATRPSSHFPTFKVEQVKAVGGAVVYEWGVSVPVCDEYPTADEAFAATLAYGARMAEQFPPPQNGGKP